MICWIASYPKSGNTWLRALFANYLKNDIGPVDINTLDLIVPNFSDRRLFDSAAGWETSDIPADIVEGMRSNVQLESARQGRTFAKTHDAFENPVTHRPLIHAEATEWAIYIVRHPLDVAVSFAFHTGRGINDAIAFMNDETACLTHPFQIAQPLGTWSWHVESWIARSSVPRYIVRYEDLLNKPLETLKRLFQFAHLPDDNERLARAIDSSSFAKLKDQELMHGFKERFIGCEAFFRSGKAHCWSKYLSESQIGTICRKHNETMMQLGYDRVGSAPNFELSKYPKSCIESRLRW
jgi:hypothetical protein